MKNQIEAIFQDSIKVKKLTLPTALAFIEEAAYKILDALKTGNKVILFGNGGSAADSQHIAAEFVGRFQKDRRPLPALSLTVDSSAITAIGNDYGYKNVFSRQLEALGKPGDVVIGISTSGNSENVVEALKLAKARKMISIGLTGGDGGTIASEVDISIVVPSDVTARIQETHILIAHTICELVENQYFS